MMKLHEHTPLIKSNKLSKICGRDVWLKLDNLQPRGLGHLVQEGIKQGKTSAVCSSAGNAGMAASYACNASNLPCTVFAPTNTPSFTVENIKSLGADVELHGDYWDMDWISNAEAVKRLTDTSVLYISPFDDPLIWEGHGTIVDELKQDLRGIKPSLIICSVGGGGLMLGILNGLKRNGWEDVPVLAMETNGADSLNTSIKAGTVVILDSIKSIAKSLGASKISSQCLPAIQAHQGGVTSLVCHDEEAIQAVEEFLTDHRFFVEPACGATLAAIYSGYLEQITLQEGPIVPIVCGGNSVSLEMIQFWKDNAYS